MSFTGRIESTVFWIYPFLIVQRNAVGTPGAFNQILLNLLVASCYVLAGMSLRCLQLTRRSG